jgi:hypothetical protein
MADNKKKKGEPDRSLINTSEKYEMQYWKDKLKVSPQQLTGAVRAVGNKAADVENYLKNKNNKK